MVMVMARRDCSGERTRCRTTSPSGTCYSLYQDILARVLDTPGVVSDTLDVVLDTPGRVLDTPWHVLKTFGLLIARRECSGERTRCRTTSPSGTCHIL